MNARFDFVLIYLVVRSNIALVVVWFLIHFFFIVQREMFRFFFYSEEIRYEVCVCFQNSFLVYNNKKKYTTQHADHSSSPVAQNRRFFVLPQADR